MLNNFVQILNKRLNQIEKILKRIFIVLIIGILYPILGILFIFGVFTVRNTEYENCDDEH